MTALGAEGRRFESCLPDHNSEEKPLDSSSGRGVTRQEKAEHVGNRRGKSRKITEAKELVSGAVGRCRAVMDWQAPKYVYFARGADGNVKIGVSCRPRVRRAALRDATGAKPDIVAVVPGDFGVERIFHEAFASDALGGEWFRPSDLLDATIAHAAKVYPHLINDVPLEQSHACRERRWRAMLPRSYRLPPPPPARRIAG